MKIKQLILFLIFIAFNNFLKAQSVTITSSASGAVCSGTNVIFTAVASNISTPTYQWYKNTVAISGATSSTYSSTALSNNDQLYVTATPGYTSNTITSTVNDSPTKPTITVNGDACINKTSLTTPTGLTSYAWYKDDVAISGATSSTYRPTTRGDYQVAVSNGTCTNTSAATTIYTCGKTKEGKMSPITSSTTLVTIAGEINSRYGVDERGLMLAKNIPTGTNPVTTGLILYLDATRTDSYGGTGNIWTDLSTQNNNATLFGSPTFSSYSNSFTIASNKYALTSNLISSLSSATFIAWVNPSQIQVDYTGIIFNRGPYSGATAVATGMNFFRNNSVGYSWNDHVTSYNWESGLKTPSNAWSMVAVTINSTRATAYLCNASGIVSSMNSATHPTLTGLKFYVGSEPADLITRAIKGRISTAMVYSSALSLSDITSIFNAQKASFGL